MELLLHWVSSHGFDLLGAVGIVASLCFTALSFERDEKSQRIGNLLALTAAHREIWRDFYSRRDLSRILERDVDLVKVPVTNEEAIFITFLLLHLHATWEAMKEGQFRTRQDVRKDINWFFSLPIPKEVWTKSRDVQDPDFVKFLESALSEKHSK